MTRHYPNFYEKLFNIQCLSGGCHKIVLNPVIGLLDAFSKKTIEVPERTVSEKGFIHSQRNQNYLASCFDVFVQLSVIDQWHKINQTV